MRARSYHAGPGACQAGVLCITLWMMSHLARLGLSAVHRRSEVLTGERLRGLEPHTLSKSARLGPP
jgi:hypothetical protein